MEKGSRHLTFATHVTKRTAIALTFKLEYFGHFVSE